MKSKIFLFLVCLTSFSFSQELKIGVLRAYDVKRVQFSYLEGSYLIQADTNAFGAILPNEFVDLRVTSDNKVELKKGAVLLGRFDSVQLSQTKPNSSIRVLSKSPSVKERKYNDNFTITAAGSELNVINNVSMNNYLSGVVESEGGGGKHLEYYKVQAIMSRTYALKRLYRHKKEGFELCDRVHCQAYHNKLIYTPTIVEAVIETEGEVMVEDNERLVDGYFHANCGGETSESDYVWNTRINYLEPFKDTFCIYTRQARWEKRIPQWEWKNYLVETFDYPMNDSVYGELIYSFKQDSRLAFFQGPQLGIPLRDIRYHFKLKSTFFSCYPEGSDVVLQGRGYGHGVGLCQEGAMKMAKFGYNYEQILLYYFPGVHLSNSYADLFFNQEVEDPLKF